MPYIKGKGLRDVYEITRVRTISAKEAKQQDGEEGENDIHLAFELRFVRRQYPCYQPVDTSKMAFKMPQGQVRVIQQMTRGLVFVTLTTLYLAAIGCISQLQDGIYR